MEGLLHYINPAHAISLLSALNEERLKGQLCDVLLIVGDQKFRAHKNILAASSKYFQSLFNNKENESQTVFQLDFCEPDAFTNVLNYIYSSSLFVEKSSLAAVQKLGCSLGISFLTNIVSKVPFQPCPSRKRVFLEEDESSSQKRSVIVCQSRNEAQGKTVSQNPPEGSHISQPSPGITSKTSTSKLHVPTPTDPLHNLSLSERSWPRDSSVGYAKTLQRSGSLDEPSRSNVAQRNAVLPSKPPQDREAAEDKAGGSGQLPKEKAIELALKKTRPPVLSLCGSSEAPYLLKETNPGGGQDRSLLGYSKMGLMVPSRELDPGNQSIDPYGPLVKSLLRMSLSVDNQVPMYSPSSDMKSSQGLSAVGCDAPGNVLCALAQKPVFKEGGAKAALDGCTPVLSPHRLRSFSASQSNRKATSPVTEVRIKTEPTSPLSDPSDIIRVTVEDAAASSLSAVTRDVSLKTEDDLKEMSRLPANRRLPFKKLKVNEHRSPVLEDNFEEGSNPPLLETNLPHSDMNKDAFGELAGTKPNKKFKCKHCLKIFRSTAGLHRHFNIYHNPEKPYACDICHKRFHTSFKVWTHCQTQHGIMKNPSPASSSQAILNEVNPMNPAKEDVFSETSGQVNFDSKDSSCLPEDHSLSTQLETQEKEKSVEKSKEAMLETCTASKEAAMSRNTGPRHCKKCGKMVIVQKPLGQPQELLCSMKSFLCHICNKAFRSNFQLWSHFHSHVNLSASQFTVRKAVSPLTEFYVKIEPSSLLSDPVNIMRVTMGDTVESSLSAVSRDFSPKTEDDSKEISRLPAKKRFQADKRLPLKKLKVNEHGSPVLEDNCEEDSNPPLLETNLPHSDTNKDAFGELEGTKPNKKLKCKHCLKIFRSIAGLHRHFNIYHNPEKPYACDICHKRFHTNFKVWTHCQAKHGM
ncbi:zinc finger and BTB domain-containing protein 21-like [Tenrec ecaudatus]|uniref:zinc finger and BTB domain-containing protein 21-like n=1 Tax=Tenrec ecaudatus TaxID=94439 RepID=UPI003F59FC56